VGVRSENSGQAENGAFSAREWRPDVLTTFRTPSLLFLFDFNLNGNNLTHPVLFSMETVKKTAGLFKNLKSES